MKIAFTSLAALTSIWLLSAFSSSKLKMKEEGPLQNTVSKYALPAREKTYCSPFAKTKYKLLINKDKIRITRLYKEYKDVFTGVIKKGKIYSNNPEEKNLKMVWGKYYKLEKNNFGVLNIENGDYEWFAECKE